MATPLQYPKLANENSQNPFKVAISDFFISRNCQSDKTIVGSSYVENCQWATNILATFEQKLRTDCTNDFTQLVDCDNKTILHHASSFENSRKGLAVAYQVLTRCCQSDWSEETFSTFVNVFDNNGLTALHYATKAKNKDLMVILIRHYADINVLDDKTRRDATKLMGDRIPKELVRLFNTHLFVYEDDIDPENELMWSVKYDFGPVVGAYEMFHETLHQTKHLATWLRRTTAKGAEDIFLHPLTQIFILDKARRYTILRIISLFYHLFFYFVWAAVAYCEAVNLNTSALEHKAADLKSKVQLGPLWSSDDDVNVHKRVSTTLEQTYLLRRYLICNAQQQLKIIPVLTICFIVVNLFKEFVFFCLCENKVNYCKQWQTWFQWFLYVPYFGLLFKHSDEFKTFYFIVSILAAITLFQDQLSKSGILGVYSEIFTHGFKNVLKICFVFLPFLTVFSVTFNLLLPMNQEFELFDYSKIASMVVGDLNYDAVFSPLGKTSTIILYPWLAKVWFLVFTVAITLLFQNLVIAATISDVQKLRKEARSIYLANRFEDIYHWENVIMHPVTQRIFRYFGWKRNLTKYLNVDRGSPGIRLDDYPLKLRNALINWYENHSNLETTKL